jgi:hypothetical protein
MTALSLEQALENVYQSLRDDNLDIDTHITALKAALAASGKKEAEVDPAKLVQNNRQGRKMMQSYFKKRGVTVVFPDKD